MDSLEELLIQLPFCDFTDVLNTLPKTNIKRLCISNKCRELNLQKVNMDAFSKLEKLEIYDAFLINLKLFKLHEKVEVGLLGMHVSNQQQAIKQFLEQVNNKIKLTVHANNITDRTTLTMNMIPDNTRIYSAPFMQAEFQLFMKKILSLKKLQKIKFHGVSNIYNSFFYDLILLLRGKGIHVILPKREAPVSKQFMNNFTTLVKILCKKKIYDEGIRYNILRFIGMD